MSYPETYDKFNKNLSKNLWRIKEEGYPNRNTGFIDCRLAIDNDMELITNNEKHYGQINGIMIDNWVRK